MARGWFANCARGCVTARMGSFGDGGVPVVGGRAGVWVWPLGAWLGKCGAHMHGCSVARLVLLAPKVAELEYTDESL